MELALASEAKKSKKRPYPLKNRAF